MQTSFFILDENNQPVAVDLVTWESSDRRHVSVGLTRVGDLEISTVFHGINLAPDDGFPLLFETMIFDRSGNAVTAGNPPRQVCRYCTWTGAEAGHAETVAAVRAAVK